MVDPVPLGDFRPDFGVRTGNLMGKRLAHIMQQPPHFGDLHIGPRLGGQHPRQQPHFYRMLQHVFAVAVPILELPQQPDQLPVQPADPHIESRLFPGFHNGLVDFPLGAVHHLLDPGGLNPPVRHQLLQRQPGDFPPHRVKAGYSHRLRGIVNNDFHPGKSFQSPNVAPLAADETPFHLIVGQGYHRRGAFRNYVRGQPVNRGRDNLARVFVRPLLILPLQFVIAPGQIVLRILLPALHHRIAGLVHGKPGDALQSLRLLRPLRLDLQAGLLDMGFLFGELRLPLILRLDLALQLLLPLQVPVLQAGQLPALLLDLRLSRVS